MRINSALLLLLPLLSACAAVPGDRVPPSPQAGRIPPTTPAPPVISNVFRPPQVLNAPGLEAVIGQGGQALIRQFGTPRLDVPEGDMRKLQFAGPACVLDVFLYPLRPGAEPVATHVDARRASDGQGVDRARCAAALRQR